MMGTAERDREFIARFTTKRARLHELQVMGIGGLAGAQEAGLLGNVPEVLLVAVAARRAQREHALVDPTGLMPLGTAAHARGIRQQALRRVLQS